MLMAPAVGACAAEVYQDDIESWNGQIASHFEQTGMAEEAIERRARGCVRAAAVCGRRSGGPAEARFGAVAKIF
jgi:hypothetical protein